MPTTNNPKQILKTALVAFTRQTGLAYEFANEAPDKQFLLLKTPETAIKLELLVIEGGALAVNAALTLYRRLQNLNCFVMVIPQVTADMADRLRNENTQFMDTAGNCYIGTLFICLPTLFLDRL